MYLIITKQGTVTQQRILDELDITYLVQDDCIVIEVTTSLNNGNDIKVVMFDEDAFPMEIPVG